MKKSLLLICSIFISVTAFGQGNRQQPVKIQKLQNWAREPRVLNARSSVDIEGTPYYNEDWRLGYVLVNKDRESNQIKLKYSAYTNELLFQENGQVMTLPADQFIGFTFTDKAEKITFKNGYRSSKYDIKPDQLMRVVYDGDVQLLAKEYTLLHKSKDPFTGNKEYNFLDKRDYYLVTADGNFHKIKLDDGDIYDALGHKNQLKQYADQHDIDFGEEQDVKSLLAAYDKMN